MPASIEASIPALEQICRLLPGVHPRRGAERIAQIFESISSNAPDQSVSALGITREQASGACDPEFAARPSRLASKLALKIYEAGLLQPCCWLGRPVKASALEAFIGDTIN